MSVGQPIDRVDGRLKVTGGAKYAAEYPLANIAHAVIITSTIAKGRVTRIDADALARVFDLSATIAHLESTFDRVRSLVPKEEPVHA